MVGKDGGSEEVHACQNGKIPSHPDEFFLEPSLPCNVEQCSSFTAGITSAPCGLTLTTLKQQVHFTFKSI